MAAYHVTVVAKSPEDLAKLIRDHGIDVLPHRLPRGPEAREIEVQAVATTEQIKALTSAGYRVERHENVTKGRAARLAEVGRRNRYAGLLKRLQRPDGKDG